jgi:hypothetical protein
MAGVLKLPKALGPMFAHLKAAVTAVSRWWVSMSVADKRQTRQRTLTVGACAAAFVLGGPLVAQRFDVQKSQEVYLNGAAVLAESIAADKIAPPLRTGMFSNKADASALLIPASYEPEPVEADEAAMADLIGSLTLRARDSRALEGLVTFTLDDLGTFTGVDRQLDCLSRAVYYEARSEDTAGQLAVAEVVMNRVRDPRFPKSICEVVYQGQYRNTGCQFTFTCDGSVRTKPAGLAWDRAKDVALHVMLGLNTPVTRKATHYHTDYVDPYWAPGLVETATIGTHIFYRFPKTSQEWRNARIALDASRHGTSSIIVLDDADAIEAGLDDVPADALPPLITVSAEPAAVALAPIAARATDGQPL